MNNPGCTLLRIQCVIGSTSGKAIACISSQVVHGL